MNNTSVSRLTSNAKNITTYTAYGHPLPATNFLLAYNGEPLNQAIKSYLLGNGYRIYSPTLMRFLSPDNISPFERKALNSYCYCQNDPINHMDPSGHMLSTGHKPKNTKPTTSYGATGTTSRTPAPTRPVTPTPASKARQQPMDSPNYTAAQAKLDVQKIKLEKRCKLRLKKMKSRKPTK